MAKINTIIATLSMLHFHCTFSFGGFKDLSNEELNENSKLFTDKEDIIKRNTFLSDVESQKLKEIPPERTDQIMSAEYMFKFLNNLENGEDIIKASGMQNNDENFEKPDTVRSFSSKPVAYHRKYDVYKFKIHSLNLEEQIKRVELRLRHNNEVVRRRTTVKYVLQQNKEVLMKYRSKEHVDVDSEYVVVDLSKTIQPLLNQVQGNLTVKVSIKKTKLFKRSKNLMRSSKKKDSKTTNDALMIIFSSNKGFFHKIYDEFTKKAPAVQLSRSKRAAQKNERKNKKNRRKRKICQLEDFDIDFNQLGWGQWIVYPKVFNGRICSGVCPSPITDELKPTNHAMLQSLMRLGQPKVAPMPCCVPTRLRPLKLLYYEGDEIVVRHHENMVAASCGCR